MLVLMARGYGGIMQMPPRLLGKKKKKREWVTERGRETGDFQSISVVFSLLFARGKGVSCRAVECRMDGGAFVLQIGFGVCQGSVRQGRCRAAVQ